MLENLSKNWELIYSTYVECKGQKIKLSKSIKGYKNLYFVFSSEPSFPSNIATLDRVNTCTLPVLSNYSHCRKWVKLVENDGVYIAIISDTEIYLKGFHGVWIAAIYAI